MSYDEDVRWQVADQIDQLLRSGIVPDGDDALLPVPPLTLKTEDGRLVRVARAIHIVPKDQWGNEYEAFVVVPEFTEVPDA
jgi:hypothetical protein